MLRTDRLIVSGQYPVPAATGVEVTTAIIIEFNMAVDEGTLTAYNVQLRDVNHAAVDITLTYDAFRRRLTIVPDEDLDPGTIYYVFIRGNERDDDDTTYLGGVMSVDEEVLVGYYQTFFITAESSIEPPILVFPPSFASVLQADAEWENGMFEWQAVDIYATDTTTTPVESGAMLADTIVINGVSISIPATTATASADYNAQTIIGAINDADCPVVASLTPSSLIIIRHNMPGSSYQVVIEDLGTYNYGNLDELGTYMANPLAPPANAYVISTEDITYDIQVDYDSTFADPVFESSDIAITYITPGILLPVDIQFYWRVRAKTTTIVSSWSNPWTFFSGTEIQQTAADGTPLVPPYYDPFKVESTSPENDSVNQYIQTITVTFNDHIYYDSVDDNSITVTGKSLVGWEEDIGIIEGTVSIGNDGMSLIFTPTISFGATIVWGAIPSSWTPTTIKIYKSSSRNGLYVYLDEIAYVEGGGTYTDTTVSGNSLYYYRLEFCDIDGNPYPRSEPIAGRCGGFRDNQIYRVTVADDVYSSDGATTESQGVSLGAEYIFFFATRLYPLYISLTQLEAIVGPSLISKFSTINLHMIMTWYSYIAYNLAWNSNLNSMEYTLQQFGEIDTVLAQQSRYFICFVAYSVAADLLRRDKLLAGSSGMHIGIGDMYIKDVTAAKGIIDPNIQAYELKALECLLQFSNSYYDDIANWAVRAAPWEGYYYSPYGPWESRSWWSDTYQGYPKGY